MPRFPSQESVSGFSDPSESEPSGRVLDVEFINTIAAFLERLAEGREFTEGDPNYEFFRYPEERRELFQYCQAVASYLHREHVPSLVIVDRSSRPMYVGVKEYWKAAWPGEAIPNIYFLNPMGFKSQEDLTYRELEDVVNDAEWKGNPRQNPGDARERGEILREFETVYRQLNKDKNQPVLVFDSCLHSGNTLEPVVRAMDDLGFSDVRVGSVNPADYGSKVKTDFYITTARPEKGCYPFDREHMIEKTFEHVYSQATKDPVKKMVANRLRAEIKAVMREFIEEEAALNNDDDPSAVSEK